MGREHHVLTDNKCTWPRGTSKKENVIKLERARRLRSFQIWYINDQSRSRGYFQAILFFNCSNKPHISNFYTSKKFVLRNIVLTSIYKINPQNSIMNIIIHTHRIGFDLTQLNKDSLS